MRKTNSRLRTLFTLALFFTAHSLFAGESDIKIPDLNKVVFTLPGGTSVISGMALMYAGLVICLIGCAFGLWQYQQTNSLPVHEKMRAVSNIIWETCKTYLFQQGKFLVILKSTVVGMKMTLAISKNTKKVKLY